MQGFTTLNASGWGSALRATPERRTPVILVQEHKLRTDEQRRTAEGRLAFMGWRATWSMAAAGKGGEASAVVAILTTS